MFARLLANLEAVSVRFDSSHREPDSTNRIRLVSRGLVMASVVRPAICDHLIHIWSKSVADPCLRFRKASVLVLAGGVGQSANEHVGFSELRGLFWIRLIILSEKDQFSQKQFSVGQNRCASFSD